MNVTRSLIDLHPLPYPLSYVSNVSALTFIAHMIIKVFFARVFPLKMYHSIHYHVFRIYIKTVQRSIKKAEVVLVDSFPITFLGILTCKDSDLVNKFLTTHLQ